MDLISLPSELIVDILSNINHIQDILNCIVNTYFKSLIFQYTHVLRIPSKFNCYVKPISLCRFYNLRYIKGHLSLSHPKDILHFLCLDKLIKAKFIFPTYKYDEHMFNEYVYEYITHTSINSRHCDILFDYTYELAGIDFKESIHIKQTVLYIFGSDPQYKLTKYGIESGKFDQIIYGAFHMSSTFKDVVHSYIHKIKLIGDFNTGISSIINLV